MIILYLSHERKRVLGISMDPQTRLNQKYKSNQTQNDIHNINSENENIRQNITTKKDTIYYKTKTIV